MTTTPTDPIVEMLIDGEWIDITADCRLGNADSGGGLEIVRGKPNEGNAAEPTQFNLTLNNGPSKVASTLGITGCYSPRNPNGPYYGLLGRNQPVRIGLSRRRDDFDRTVSSGWGDVPAKTQVDGSTVAPPEMWHVAGLGSAFSVTPGAAAIQSSSASRLVTFGTYSDADMLTRFKISTRDTEAGFVLRMLETFLDPPITLDPTFETGISGWVGNGGTLTLNTVNAYSGTKSAQLTMAGGVSAPTILPNNTTPYMWGEGKIKPGTTYRHRMRVYVPTGGNTTAVTYWYRADGTFINDSVSSYAPAAATWTTYDSIHTAPTDAAWARPGVRMTGTPAAGTILLLDAVELYRSTAPYWYTANFVPGATDIIKFGKVTDFGDSFTGNLGQQLIADEWYYMRAQITRQRFRMKMWKEGDPEPSAWQLRWFDDATVSEEVVGVEGEIGLFASGGTGIVTYSFIEVNQWRAHAEIAALPPRWDLSRSDRWVPVQARGILRRMGQGRKALRSATSLYLESHAANSHGWWPLEENTGDLAGNNITGGQQAAITGMEFSTPDLSGDWAMPGLAGFATFTTDTGMFIGNVRPHQPGTHESIMFFLRIPAAPSADTTVATYYSTGTARTWSLTFQVGASMQVRAWNREGVLIANQAFLLWPGMTPGSWIAGDLVLFQDGANVDWAWNYHKPGTTDFWTNSGTFAGQIGVFTSVKITSSAILTAAGNLSIAHVMHHSTDFPFVSDDFTKAANAYIGELATYRFQRLLDNAGIANTVTGLSTTSTPMGAQLPAKLVDLVEECAQVEDGIVMEERGDFELAMRTRDSMWNGLATYLDIDAGHLSPPLDPSDDDQLTRNDVTVKRANGGFARSIQETGPLNVQAPEDDANGVGVYDEQIDINFATDDQVQSAADWRRSRGTQDESRYPSIHADLASRIYQTDSGLVAEVLALDAGDPILLRNTEVSADPTYQMVQSYTEKIDLFDHGLTWVTSPAAIHRVGVVNFNTRLDSMSNSVQAPFVVGTDTRLMSDFDGGVGSRWVTPDVSEASFPFDIVVSGVQLRVVVTGDQLVPNGDFSVDATGWLPTSANVTLAWDNRQPRKNRDGQLRITVLAAGTDGAEQDPRPATVPGESYFVSCWVKTETVAATDFRLAVDWYQSNGTTFISTSLPTPIVTVADTWTYYSATVVAPALGARAKVRARNVFAAAGVIRVDSVRFVPVSSYAGDPQTLTVEPTPVNGVYKTIPAGSVIRVAEPWRLAW